MRQGIAVRTAVVALALTCALPLHAGLKSKKDPERLRAEYITRLQQQTVPQVEQRQLGSLWAPNSVLGDLSTDYKARGLNDTIIISVSVRTSATQSGSVSSQRDFSTSSGISGLPGRIPTGGVSTLLGADSGTQLKGQGQSAANSALATSLTGQVIAVLSNGNLVVEAQRQIAMNNQRETMVVRGVVRPGDIGPNNVVASTSLANLEIELKGKGIISDSVRPPNPITRAVLWLFGF